MRAGAVHAAWRARLAEAGLPRIDDLLDAGAAGQAAPGVWQRLSKPGLGGRSRWRWEFEAGGERQVVFIKHYERPALRRQLGRMAAQSIGHSSAWWEFRQAQRLAELHVPAAAAVAYVEDMRGPFEARSAVVLECAPGEAFDRWWTARRARGDPLTEGAARHDLTRRLARFVAAFHQTGLRHRDLYLCHVFVHHEGRDAPQLRLIDLARVFRPRWRRTRWLLKDLSQLDASARRIGATRADRLRFLLAYLALQRLSPPVRALARRVLRRSDRILRRQRRKDA